jgi:hypothetical protein
MKFGHHAGGIALTLVTSLAFLTTGCNSKGTGGKDGPAKNKDAQAKATMKSDPGAKKADTVEAKHAGWWCEEHGVPEQVCSLCSATVAAKCKKDGDWCKLHDRAESQCFKCDPSKYAKYEAMYEAKYGKKPPRPPEEEFQK